MRIFRKRPTHSQAVDNLIVVARTVLEHLPDRNVEGSWDAESARLLREALTDLGVAFVEAKP